MSLYAVFTPDARVLCAHCANSLMSDLKRYPWAREIPEDMKRPNGLTLYTGPSAIDGAPIVVILTGLAKASTNSKTGGMLQTYILRADMPPTEAKRAGLDGSICGDCSQRSRAAGGSGACYVNAGQGPRSVWYAWKRGNYPTASLDVASAAVAGRKLRIGSYGDPAAVPDAGAFWARLASLASMRTGYTHQWRRAPALRGLVMASVDSPAERDEAQALGWATFRVRGVDESAERARGEAQCPASAEAGRRVTCAGCPLACDGSASAILGRVIAAHGATRRRFAQRMEA